LARRLPDRFGDSQLGVDLEQSLVLDLAAGARSPLEWAGSRAAGSLIDHNQI